jgi:TM2 domain-containing membrane protein YozV
MALEAIEGSSNGDLFENTQFLEKERAVGKVAYVGSEELSSIDYKTQAFLATFGFVGLDDFYAGNYSRGWTKLAFTMVGTFFLKIAPVITSMLSLMVLSRGTYADSDGKLIRQVVQLRKEEISSCDQTIMLILSSTLGMFGAHQFYAGKPLKGVLMLCTGGGLGIWAMINIYQLVTCGFKDGEGKTVCSDYIKLAHNVRP